MSDQYTIFVDDDRWSVGVLRDDDVCLYAVDFEDDAPIQARAEAARRLLESIGYEGRSILLALPSSWCLCAEFSVDGLERKGRRRAMGFLLEEHLPISVEEVVADYQETGDGKTLGVCCELDKLRPIIEAIESSGVAVRHISPAALLAAGGVLQSHPETGALLADWRDETPESSRGGCDLIRLRDGGPTCWWWLPGDGQALGEQFAAWGRLHDCSVTLASARSGGSTDAIHQAHNAFECVELENTGPPQEAVRCAAGLLSGSAEPWIDLRRDALAAPGRSQVFGRPLGALVAAAVLLLISICVVCQWRGWEYRGLREQYARRQVSVFKDTLPTQRVPGGGIKRRLLSERRKMAELSGQSLDESAAKPLKTVSALWRLRDILKNLPKGVRYRILDWSIQPDQIRISGQARSHAEAEQIVSSLRQSGLYEVDPPETRALGERGVSFEFVARPSSPRASKPLPSRISMTGGVR